MTNLPNECPNCGSTKTDVEQYLEYRGLYSAFDRRKCLDCGCEWENLYSYHGTEIIEEGDEEVTAND